MAGIEAVEEDLVDASNGDSGSVTRAEGRPATLRLSFTAGQISELRHQVASYCSAAGLAGQALDDFVLAVYELLTNAVRYGDGDGQLRLWPDGGALVCEVRDAGSGFTPPVTVEDRPNTATPGGLGLWLADQLADSMRIDSGPAGTTIVLRSRSVSNTTI